MFELISCFRRGAMLLAMVVAAVVLLGGVAVAQPLPQEQQQIAAAAPAQAIAQPKKPRTLLIFTRTEGFKHASIPVAAAAVVEMGRRTGAYAAVVRDDMAAFDREFLRTIDAICLISTTQLAFEDPQQRKNLLDFVRSGKGIAGIHAASDNFYTWPEAAAMLGGLFDGHPWQANGTWAIKVDDPEHPLTAAFAGQGFRIRDEIYRIKAPFSRENLRVLLSLDFADEATNQAEGIRTSDFDVPVSWLRRYGNGRVFYSSLGHNSEVFWNPAVLRHYLDGIQYALGDLDADATPSVERALQAVARYRYGASRAPITELDNFIRFSRDSTAALERLEQRLLTFFQQARTTTAGKQLICDWLSQIGGDKSAAILGRLLLQPETSDMARFALERLPSPEADRILRDALSQLDGATRIGVIASIGQRRDPQAVVALRNLLASKNPATSDAALAALGQIGTPAASEVLLTTLPAADGKLRARTIDALLLCAEQLSDQNDPAGAIAIYRELYNDQQPAPVQYAALRGLLLAGAEEAGALVLDALHQGDSVARTTALRLIPELPASDIEEVVDVWPLLSTAQQWPFVAALAGRRQPAVREAISAMTGSADPAVRGAALAALATSGNAESVMLLAEAAAQNDPLREVARTSLYRLRGSDIDQAILQELDGAEIEVQVELIRAIEQRRIMATAPRLLELAQHDDRQLRLQSMRALREVAGQEQLPALLQLLNLEQSDGERRELERAIAATALRQPDTPSPAAPILAALPATPSPQARASLYQVLGRIGDPAALPMLRGALQASDREAYLAAIRALGEWPTPAPAADLLTIARSATDKSQRILALRGYLQLASLDGGIADSLRLSMLQQAIPLATEPAEQRRVLGALANLRSAEALRLAQPYLQSPSLRAEAEVAILRIAEQIPPGRDGSVKPALQEIANSSADSTRKQKATSLVQRFEAVEDYIIDWQVAGPYTRKDADLFAVAFAPETARRDTVAWRAISAGTNPGQYWRVELDRLIGGYDRVVYLRTRVYAEQAQPARLELGSDDGVKAWLNGELVHSINTVRWVEPGQDVVGVSLQAGWNELLLKIVNGSGGWGACARLRQPDGSRLTGLRYGAND